MVSRCFSVIDLHHKSYIRGAESAIKVPFCDYGPKTYRKRIRFDRPGKLLIFQKFLPTRVSACIKINSARIHFVSSYSMIYRIKFNKRINIRLFDNIPSRMDTRCKNLVDYREIKTSFSYTSCMFIRSTDLQLL
jgi:hypothetical protein